MKMPKRHIKLAGVRKALKTKPKLHRAWCENNKSWHKQKQNRSLWACFESGLDKDENTEAKAFWYPPETVRLFLTRFSSWWCAVGYRAVWAWLGAHWMASGSSGCEGKQLKGEPTVSQATRVKVTKGGEGQKEFQLCFTCGAEGCGFSVTNAFCLRSQSEKKIPDFLFVLQGNFPAFRASALTT